jgi:alanine dehydrogenase
VKIADISQTARETYAREMQTLLGLKVTSVGTIREATINSDIVVTATPATRPIVNNEDISDGTHLNLMGADAPGKQEIDPEILRHAKIVVDDYEQAIMSGEINVPIKEGLIPRRNICGELGEILIGTKVGRESAGEITVFDSTGIAAQDVAVAWEVYKKAKKSGRGLYINLF